MAKNQKHQNLKVHIEQLSVSNNFAQARFEWKLTGIELRRNWHNCPCSQPIKELCHLINTSNGNTTFVGNVCVRKFFGINTGNVFTGLKRIEKDVSANMNSDLRNYSLNHGIIRTKDFNFLKQIKNTKNTDLSPAQLKYKRDLNAKVISKLIK